MIDIENLDNEQKSILQTVSFNWIHSRNHCCLNFARLLSHDVSNPDLESEFSIEFDWIAYNIP